MEEALDLSFDRLRMIMMMMMIRPQRDMIKNVYWSLCKVPVNSCRILMKLEFSRQIFGKHSNIKFYENPASGSDDEDVPY